MGVKTCDLFCKKPFKFEFDYHGLVCDKHHQESIKQCGVFPVCASAWGLNLFGSSSKEVFELESLAQISDTDTESRPKAIGVGGSDNENENEWEQLLHVITSSV